MNVKTIIDNIYLRFIMIFLIIFISRIVIISFYGVDVPVDDQWDAEWSNIYLPFLEGHLSPKVFFSHHNEHIIFFTRLLNFFFFYLTKSWSNLTVMFGQSTIVSAALSFIISVNYKKFNSLFYFIVAILIGLTPFGYKNMLYAFQNQFYFLIIFSVISVYLISQKRPDLYPWAFLFSIFSFISMAPGALIFTVCSIGLFFNYINKKEKSELFYLILFLFASFLSLLLIYKYRVPGHNHLKAHGIKDFIISLINILKYPSILEMSLFFIPVIYLTYKKYKAKSLWDILDCNFYVLIWCLAVFSSIAYARRTLNARYHDIVHIYLLTFYIVIIGEFNLNKYFNYYRRIFACLIIVILFSISTKNFKCIEDSYKGLKIKQLALRNYLDDQEYVKTNLPYPVPQRILDIAKLNKSLLKKYLNI